jgi:SAM-dependent methyltransferase
MMKLNKEILEISPNWAPLVLESDLLEEGTIQYCDRMPSEWLSDREKNNPGRVSYNLEVMENDFVWTPGLPLKSCTAKEFDYVISSHVVEHVPDLLGHLIEVASVLKHGGEYVFVIPNARGTGEYFRRLSEESDVIEHFFRGGDRTSPGQNWDYLRKIIKFDGTSMSEKNIGAFVRHHTDQEAIQDVLRCFKEYVDVHCWVFNRESFLTLIDSLGTLKLMPFRVSQFADSGHLTADGEPVEFVICLKKIDFEIPEEWQNYLESKKKFSWYDSSRAITEKPEDSIISKESELKTLKQESLMLESDLLRISRELDLIIHSKSWNLTKPLRTIRKYLRS